MAEGPKVSEREQFAAHIARVASQTASAVSLHANENGHRPFEVADVDVDISETDVGLAACFADMFGARFRYLPPRRNEGGQWLFYDGNRWQRQDHETLIDQYIEKMGRKLLREAAAATTEGDRKHFQKIGNRSLSTAGIAAIRSRIAVVDGIVADENDFDQHPHLLSVANGVVNLRTKELLSADPALMLSRGSHYRYNPDARAPTWCEFLLQVFADNKPEALAYESDLGYTLTGESREHVVFVDWGPTSRNGKTTVQEAVKHILGLNLCVTSAPGSFLQGRYNHEPDRTRNDMVRWRGARMIQTSELPESAQLDGNIVKQLSGADTITARRNYGGEEEFVNQGKLWIRTNNFPELDPDDDAIWNRVRLHEFRVSFKGREDKDLPKKLRAEAEGILARLVQRAHEYYQRGSLVAVSEETVAELRRSMDFLGDILERRFERDIDAYTTKSRVKEIVTEEYKEAGEKAPNFAAGFDQRMARKRCPAGRRKINSKTTRVFFGLRERGEEGLETA
jgi:putative DNA primase/helicase